MGKENIASSVISTKVLIEYFYVQHIAPKHIQEKSNTVPAQKTLGQFVNRSILQNNILIKILTKLNIFCKISNIIRHNLELNGQILWHRRKVKKNQNRNISMSAINIRKS